MLYYVKRVDTRKDWYTHIVDRSGRGLLFHYQDEWDWINVMDIR